MPSTPRTLIYGAGAVGSLLGGLLTEAGLPVTLLGRSALAEAVRRGGLHIARPAGDLVVQPPVITTLQALVDPPELVLLTVKAYEVEPALPEMERLAAAGAAIVSLQNGVGTEETLLATGRIARLASGALTVSVSRVSERPGEVRQETDGGLALAPVLGSAPLAALATALNQAGLACGVTPSYQALKWSKLLLNILGNATSAILAIPPVFIFHDARLFQVERAAFMEALAVMLADGITPIGLPGYNVPLLAQTMRLPAALSRRLLARRVGRGRGEKRPSLWLDLERASVSEGEHGHQTEVDWLNGAVASRGAALGIPTPVNAALTTIVDEIAGDPARHAPYRGRPDTLLARLR